MPNQLRPPPRALFAFAVCLAAGCGAKAQSEAPPAAGGADTGDNPNAALANYAGTIYGCVMEKFSMNAAQWNGMKVHLQIKVSPDGTMASPVVSKPSNDPDYDAAVVAAAEACKTLPPPPPEVAPKLDQDGLQIVFESPG